MIVKFFKNSGGGSANATMNYLLGKENDREGARLLSGDPELTKRLSGSLSFQNRYTVGVLSFEEKNLPDEDKRAIMESFESSLLAGLDKHQYNITWIEHTDKERLGVSTEFGPYCTLRNFVEYFAILHPKDKPNS